MRPPDRAAAASRGCGRAASVIRGGVAIGIDIGTSGIRAALVDAEGAALAFGASPLDQGHGRGSDPHA
jgi:hypothetical protein